jgi:hypothetical protein
MNAGIDWTREPLGGLNGLIGLEQNQYYWCRWEDGTRIVAKLENNLWWIAGNYNAVAITRDQIICMIQPPEN